MNSEQIVSLADTFDTVIRRDLGPALYAEAVRRNRDEPHPGVCATHDHCDANESMAEAFEEVTGREVDPDSDEDSALWSEAWDVWMMRYCGPGDPPVR